MCSPRHAWEAKLLLRLDSVSAFPRISLIFVDFDKALRRPKLAEWLQEKFLGRNIKF